MLFRIILPLNPLKGEQERINTKADMNSNHIGFTSYCSPFRGLGGLWPNTKVLVRYRYFIYCAYKGCGAQGIDALCVFKGFAYFVV